MSFISSKPYNNPNKGLLGNRIVFLLLILMLPFSRSFSQIPAGYYDPAIGLTGTFLQQALHDIIKDHTVKSYSYLWTAFQSTDAKPNGTVWDMYSDIPNGTPNGNPPYVFQFITDQCGTASQEGDCYSREHSFPKAWFGGEVTPMYTDLFHIYPEDQYVNNRHSDNPMGEITTPTWTSLNGSKVGPCTTEGYTGTVFEPRDEYKGDIARSYFYMAVRYYTEDGGWPGSDMVSGSQPLPWALEMLIRWHQSDPVSAKEIARNNVIYTIQHNRNPFIDHPEYVAAIWSSAPIKPEPTNHATNFQSTAGPPVYSAITLSWSDATGEVVPDGYLIRGSATGYDAIQAPVDGVPVINGGLNLNVAAGTQQCVITGLSSSTRYYFKIFPFTNAKTDINYKTGGTVPQSSATTGAATGSGEIVISQYYEGTSYNKWIEITNLGPDVNLATHPVYLLMISGSGPRNVTTTNPGLCASMNTGTFKSGTSRLVRNPQTVVPVYATADYSNGNLDFNGVYDVVFLSAVSSQTAPAAWNARTDVVGEVINNLTTATSIADMSLIRRNNITSGSTVWSFSDWTQATLTSVDNAAAGTPERLGYHGFNYFSKPTGNLDDLQNWGTSPDGSGMPPASWNFINQRFTLQNRSSATVGAPWTLLGTGTRLIVGDGSNGTTFSNTTFNLYLPALEIQPGSTVVVNNGTTLTLPGTITPDGIQCLTLRNGAAFTNDGTTIINQDLVNENFLPTVLGAGTIQLAGVARQRITGANLFHGLSINNANGISLEGNTRVEGLLWLWSGNIRLNGYRFTLGAEAAVAGAPSASSMILITPPEKVYKEFPPDFTGSVLFPLGDTLVTTDYSPVTLTFTQGLFDAGNEASVTVTNQSYPDPLVTGNFLNRYWTLEQTGITGFECNAQFSYVPGDVTGEEAAISCARIDPLPVVYYGKADTMEHRFTAEGLASFSTFTGLETPGIPEQLSVDGTLSEGAEQCYNATQTITVAGNGAQYLVESGATATLIAGENILINDGTRVMEGGSFQARITATGDYCGELSRAMTAALNAEAATGADKQKAFLQTGMPEKTSFFRIYPNPATGFVFLETAGDKPDGEFRVTVSNMTGKNIFSETVHGESRHLIPLVHQSPGVYIVQVIQGERVEQFKVIRN